MYQIYFTFPSPSLHFIACLALTVPCILHFRHIHGSENGFNDDDVDEVKEEDNN